MIRGAMVKLGRYYALICGIMTPYYAPETKFGGDDICIGLLYTCIC